MQWYAPASGKRGRQRFFSDAAIQFCQTIKCLFGLALRQSLGWRAFRLSFDLCNKACKHYSVRSIRLRCLGTHYARARRHGRSRLTDSSWSIIRTPTSGREHQYVVDLSGHSRDFTNHRLPCSRFR